MLYCLVRCAGISAGYERQRTRAWSCRNLEKPHVRSTRGAFSGKWPDKNKEH